MVEKTLRCAVYTRKSTEDGLLQEFNSLDAQYEACAAYALSQRHEGWALNPERYDDGGFSGGNMQRPGLVRLLADVAADHLADRVHLKENGIAAVFDLSVSEHGMLVWRGVMYSSYTPQRAAIPVRINL